MSGIPSAPSREGGSAGRAVQDPLRVLRTPGLRLRRWLFLGLVAGTTAGGAGLMLDILQDGGTSPLEITILALFAATFGWISIAFWNAVIGFTLMSLRRHPLSLRPTPATPGPRPDAAGGLRQPPIAGRTALVMPVYEEDPERVMRGLAATIGSLVKTGEAGSFDVHLLSDTADAAIARREEAAWRALRQQWSGVLRLFYRRREDNVGRKAGNIADFCRRWGDRYDYMVPLDADSVMSGASLVELVRTLEANPDTGLIQTVPVPADQASIFGRLLQFAACLHSPVLATGQSFWQGDAANYWGHNAIVRMRAFVDNCSLPVLPGEPPLGGEILSHDFVEAALLRRGGWKVYLLPSLGGSLEDVPATIPDYARRDRRWSQGSLQHLRLLTLPGLHPVSRLHFLVGAMGYVSSLLWLLMLLAGTAYVLLGGLGLEPSFTRPQPWLAGWPVPGAGRIGSLLAATAVVLFAPKVLASALALSRRRQAFGGGLRLLASASLEMAFGVLIAPLMMMFHTRSLLSILSGHDIEWCAQRRDGGDLTWTSALRSGGWITGIGAVWGAATLSTSPAFFLWLTPILVGLLLAAPLVRWTSSRRLGRLARRVGLFLVSSEPPGRPRRRRSPATPSTSREPRPAYATEDRPSAPGPPTVPAEQPLRNAERPLRSPEHALRLRARTPSGAAPSSGAPETS